MSGLTAVMRQPEFPECELHIPFIDQKVFWPGSRFPAEDNHGERQHGAECDTGTDDFSVRQNGIINTSYIVAPSNFDC